MDSYEEAIKKLRSDTRTLNELEQATGIPAETLRDIKNRICKNPRYETVKKLAKFYERAA
jgi:hypothetical protein